ncbi:MAG: O-antigen ligase family protein [Bacteroidia bacterium]
MKKWFNRLVWLTFALIPLSYPVALPGGWMIQFPSEMLISLLMAIVLPGFLAGNLPERKVLVHPISILLTLQLIVGFFSSIFSEVPLVAFKRVAIYFLYFTVFYVWPLRFFRDKKLILRYFWAVLAGLLVVVLITSVRHGFWGFEQRFAEAMPRPFFPDHTLYGGVIAFLFPFVVFGLKNLNYPLKKPLLYGLCALLFAGLFLSYSRGAWLSLGISAGVAGCWLIFSSCKWLKWLVTGSVLGVILLIFMLDPRGYYRENVSDQERINRWFCAVRLWKERPLLGWGPGTYQYVYGRYQNVEEMTRISTYQGNMGNAHSEYLGPLAETGILGGIIPLLVLFFSLRTGENLLRIKSRQNLIALGILSGLVTFWIHGLMNAFLDQDKMAVLVYGALAALVVMEKFPEEL